MLGRTNTLLATDLVRFDFIPRAELFVPLLLRQHQNLPDKVIDLRSGNLLRRKVLAVVRVKEVYDSGDLVFEGVLETAGAGY